MSKMFFRGRLWGAWLVIAVAVMLSVALGGCAGSSNPYVACQDYIGANAQYENCVNAYAWEQRRWSNSGLGAAGMNLYNQAQETERAHIYSQGNALSGQHYWQHNRSLGGW